MTRLQDLKDIALESHLRGGEGELMRRVRSRSCSEGARGDPDALERHVTVEK
jgi:hypothetical protein